jgi:hypothetical protein
MPAQAVLVRMIVLFEHEKWAHAGLKKLGVPHYSFHGVSGHGATGARHGGFTSAENVSFTIVTTQEKATAVLHWFEKDGIPLRAGLAWSSEVTAVLPPPHSK